MRIALVGPTYPYKGGIAFHTTQLAHRLAGDGHDVGIESWHAQYPALLYPGAQTVSTPDGEPFPASRRELAWYRPDGWHRVGSRLGRSCELVVVTLTTPVQIPAYLGVLRGVRRHGGARVVALCHNVLPHERRSYDVALTRALMRRVDGALTHSADQARLALSLAPDLAVRSARLPPSELTGAGQNAGQNDGTDNGAGGEPYRRLLFFGMVRPYKGLDVLLRALAAGPPDVTLLVAGEFWGGHEGTERLVDELGLTERVELRPGYVPAGDIPVLYAGVDALVLPYRTATGSMQAATALGYGVPVIATSAGALADDVRDGENGLVCEPDDTDALTAALHRFYRHGEPARLRANVRAVDPEPYWARYVHELCSLAAAR